MHFNQLQSTTFHMCYCKHSWFHYPVNTCGTFSKKKLSFLKNLPFFWSFIYCHQSSNRWPLCDACCECARSRVRTRWHTRKWNEKSGWMHPWVALKRCILSTCGICLLYRYVQCITNELAWARWQGCSRKLILSESRT